jgi:hypothetical protein
MAEYLFTVRMCRAESFTDSGLLTYQTAVLIDNVPVPNELQVSA